MLAFVADDLLDRRSAIAEELRRHGHDVETGNSAAEVLAAAVRVPALVVLGWQVGGESALDLCRALRGLPEQEEPVVVLVGARDEVDVSDALAAGAADVWPVDLDDAPGAVSVRLSLAEHYARLQVENLRVGGEFALMRQALDLTGTGFVLTDPLLQDNPIVYANRSFYEMTGYPEEEVLGHNCRFLQGQGTDPEDVARLRRAVIERRPVTVELLNRKRDGTPFFNEVHVAPVFDARGEVVRFVGVQVDVTAYRQQEGRFASEQRARRKAEAEQRRSAFLAAASPTLDAQLNLRSTLESLAAISVPRLADLCLVEVVRDGQARRVTARAARPGLERAIEALPAVAAFDPAGDGPLARVLRTGQAEVVDDRSGPVVDGPVGALLDERSPHHPVRQWMIVPLRARGRTTGALLLAALDGERRFGPEELRLAEDLALRAGLALDNARLYEEQVDVARTLQRSFLPHALPRIPGLELAARYRPAETAIEIGGDFYDVASLGHGGATISVGDVTGKGAGAAALTGLARHTLRVARMYEPDGPSVLHALNRVLVQERADRGRYCTAVVADVRPAPDPAGGMAIDVVCGGHPAPYVVRAADGAIEVLGGRGTILGWVDDPKLPTASTVLRPGDTIVFFTDGVSAGDEGGPLSDAELRRELQRWGDRDVATLAEQLQLAALRGQLGRPADDVVIVVARAVDVADAGTDAHPAPRAA